MTLERKNKTIRTSMVTVLSVAVMLSAILVLAPGARADTASKCTSCCADSPCSITSDPNYQKSDSDTSSTDSNAIIDHYVNPLIGTLSAAVGIAAAISIIWSGIQYSMSTGDPQKAAAAKQHIINTIIGLVGFFALYGVFNWLIPGGI